MTDVTVCIPTISSRAALLTEALASVQAQTILPQAVSIVYDLDHKGAAHTRNLALKASHTTYTAFLDDDDLLYSEHLQLLVEQAERTGADLVYPWFDGGEHWLTMPVNGERVSPFGRLFLDEQRQWLLQEQNFIPITFLVRTELAQAVGGFPQPNTPAWPYGDAEDYGFLRNLLTAGAAFEHLPVKTWMWRMHEGRTRGYVK